jgi:long-subunit fatty acid transport protein
VEPKELSATNVFEWQDALTLRAGVEYGYAGEWFFRGGFIYDGKVSNEQYPSAFGTPPTYSLTLTAGVGYKHGDDWKLNFAFAQRFASTKVDTGTPSQACAACAYDGDYSLTMTGLYLDFAYAFPKIFD